jgi:hypothetical protein
VRRLDDSETLRKIVMMAEGLLRTEKMVEQRERVIISDKGTIWIIL